MINKKILKQMGFKSTFINIYEFQNLEYSQNSFIVYFGVKSIDEIQNFFTEDEIVIAKETTMQEFFKKFFEFIHCDGQCYGCS